MGTRADFYVGRGEEAEWLGSIAYDGYEVDEPILEAKTEEDFREAVAEFLKRREDATTVDMGWPWPWPNSNTTDYSYAFDGGIVWATCFGHGWYTQEQKEAFDKAYSAWEEAVEEDEDLEEPTPPWEPPDGSKLTFPDMTDKQNVTLGARSGLMIVSLPK